MIDTLSIEIGRFIEKRQLLDSKEQQYRELSLYSSLLRHDLKNDLGVILANVDLTRMLVCDSDEATEEIIMSTEAVCTRMMNLLNAFGRASDEMTQDLIQIIKSLATSAMEIHSGLDVRIEVHDNDSSLIIPGSRLLPLVFENLLRNAATHAGEHCKVLIDVMRKGCTVMVRLSDDGPGVSESVRKKLFQKGVSTRGGGLGLYLSKQVVETMNGSIELGESNPGEGAVFNVRLPLIAYGEKV
jgi:signal transduction histidine kinase